MNKPLMGQRVSHHERAKPIKSHETDARRPAAGIDTEQPWVKMEKEDKCQTACKPGSVHTREGRWMTIHLGRPLPDASRDQPGRLGRKQTLPDKAGAPPLFGLAPGGVYHAAPVAGGAVRSYRTLSPLPDRAAVKRPPTGRFAFCGTFPRVSPAGRYPAPCFRGARTFLPRADCSIAAAVIQPSGTG